MAKQKGIQIRLIHVVAIALGILLLSAYGYINLGINLGPGEEGPPSGLVSVTKPLKFAVTDPLAGAAIASATVAIYDGAGVLLESLTTDSDGTKSSALPYESGATVRVKLSKTDYVTRWVDVVVPKMNPADAESLTTNFVALTTYNLGTYSIKATDQFGNSYSSGDELNFTNLSASTVTLTVTIYNTEDNSGYITSYDYLNEINLNAVLQTSTTGSDVTVTGAGSSSQRGTTSYWLKTVADDGLTRQLVGTTYVKAGVSSVSITLGKGALSLNDSQAFVLALYDYFDVSYFGQNGIGGPDATALATFNLTVSA